jgi:hypothetical protein
MRHLGSVSRFPTVVLRLGNIPSQKFPRSQRDKHVNSGIALLKDVQNCRRQLLAKAVIAPSRV